MNTLALKTTFYKYSIYFLHLIKIRLIKSLLQRRLYESQYKDYKLFSGITTMEKLENLMHSSTWQNDSKRLGDSVSYPGAIQHRFDKGQPIGDCDDFAVLACAYIDKEKLADSCHMLSVHWLTNGEHHGHMVCVYEVNNQLFMIGNWFGGTSVGPYNDYYEIARSVAGTYFGNTLLTHSLIDWKTLKALFIKLH